MLCINIKEDVFVGLVNSYVGVVEDASQNNAPSIRSVNNALSGGGLDLDLNACEENPEVVQLSFSTSSRQGISQFPSRSLLPAGFSHSEPSSSRGFDLNNGPGGEDLGGESVSFSKSGMQFMSTIWTSGTSQLGFHQTTPTQQ